MSTGLAARELPATEASQTSRLNSSFESSRPAGRQHDPVGLVDRQELGGEGPAEDVGERRLVGGGAWQAAVCSQPEDRGLGGRGLPVERSAPPGGQPWGPSGSLGRRERLDVSPEMGGVPASCRTVERMGARADASYGRRSQ